MRQINAPNGCIKQIADKWLRNSIFQNYLANVDDEEKPGIRFCKTLFTNRQPLKNVTNIGDTTLIGTFTTNNSILHLMRKTLNKPSGSIKIYDRCIHKAMFFHSVNYNRALKTDDSVIETKAGEIIQIHHIVIYENKCYICGYKWIVCANDFSKNNETVIVRHIWKLQKIISTYIVIDINMIKRKIVVIDTKENIYVSVLPNMFEIQ